ncbi:anti-sigma factor [Cohnella caldifontis]|uniref:anti-sigma factor n=1 Tax=Cohnella caldifontis TaxID=3027471 RepID=UPI0023EA92EA|nr:anti-sigma factor [Cohnella sp. YIM B05605]
MNERSCGVPEEKWIDWHLKRLPEETAWAMERHLETCAACRRTFAQWRELLGKPEVSAETGTAGDPMPGERVRRSLRMAVWRRSWKKRLAKRPLLLAGAALACVLLVSGLLLRELPQRPVPEARSGGLAPLEYARLHEPVGAAVISDPDTKVYAVASSFAPGVPVADGKKAVTVWVNGRTGEMFVLIEGLLPADTNDLQAWGDVPGGLTSLGLVEFHRAQGHLYSHLPPVRDVRDVSFTIEPKGGSEKPTAPETAHVKLTGSP